MAIFVTFEDNLSLTASIKQSFADCDNVFLFNKINEL
jgi:hypothetical protein